MCVISVTFYTFSVFSFCLYQGKRRTALWSDPQEGTYLRDVSTRYISIAQIQCSVQPSGRCDILFQILQKCSNITLIKISEQKYQLIPNSVCNVIKSISSAFSSEHKIRTRNIHQYHSNLGKFSWKIMWSKGHHRDFVMFWTTGFPHRKVCRPSIIYCHAKLSSNRFLSFKNVSIKLNQSKTIQKKVCCFLREPSLGRTKKTWWW